jgi:hypothetical protein
LSKRFRLTLATGYQVRDGDGIYGERVARTLESPGIDEVVTAPASPRQNAYAERVIGQYCQQPIQHADDASTYANELRGFPPD